MVNTQYNPFSLEGKTILVTGASSGIGRVTAIECSRMGATAILSARNVEKLNETLSMMEGEGHIVLPADLSKEEDICKLARTVPKLNGVASIAGFCCLKPLKFYSKSAVEDIFSINTFASMYLIRELLRCKVLSIGASLVFISSISSTFAPANANGIYAASKAAIDAFSRQCALELASKGIRSNTICPGLVNTDLLANNSLYSEEDIEYSNILSRVSLFSRLGEPKEVALSAVFLLSDASSFITGSSIVIDGGYHINFNIG